MGKTIVCSIVLSLEVLKKTIIIKVYVYTQELVKITKPPASKRNGQSTAQQGGNL